MFKISEELKNKLVIAASAEEVLALLKEEFAEATLDDAVMLFNRIRSSEKGLDDNELADVNGGSRTYSDDYLNKDGERCLIVTAFNYCNYYEVNGRSSHDWDDFCCNCDFCERRYLTLYCTKRTAKNGL